MLKVQAWPQPDPVLIRVELNRRAASLRLRIYSKAYVLLAESLSGPAGPGWVSLALPPEYGGFGPGLYYFRVDAGGQASDGKSGILVKLP